MSACGAGTKLLRVEEVAERAGALTTGGRSASAGSSGARLGRSAGAPTALGRYLLAVRRDESWAGSMATTQPRTTSPATMPEEERDIAKPCKRRMKRSFGAG